MKWPDKRTYPILLSDGSAPALALRLQEGEVHVLIWCAAGVGWEMPACPPSTSFDLARLPTDLAPTSPDLR